MRLPLVAFLLSILGGCSFFQTHEYATCEVTWECEECTDVQVKVFSESASGEDSKEVEVPIP